jgi:hypothetical protein
MKNIILCSDGTGNSGGKTRGTNVWRIYNVIDRFHSSVEQVTFYDDGVGTENLKWLKLLGGAFGWGLSRNIRQLYSFLVMNYQPGDKIFLFGFSRGAFTVRALSGMICKCGLWDRQQYIASKNRDKIVNRILKAYRQVKHTDLDKLKSEQIKLESVEIKMIGVWDTVDAVGIPSDNLRDWVDIWYKAITGRRLYGFHDQVLSDKVKYGFQALALDDERKTFQPNIWEPRKNVEQVWFAGVHSNIGGGYPQDGLSYVALDWMMCKAEKLNLKFYKDVWNVYREAANVNAKMYDSRTGLAMFYAYDPRVMIADSLVHISVFDRIKKGNENYAPSIINVPIKAAYTEDGPYKKDKEINFPALNETINNKIKRLVIKRKILYYTFVIFNVLAAILIVWEMFNPHPAKLDSLFNFDANWYQVLIDRLEIVVKLLVPGFLERVIDVIWLHKIWSISGIVIFYILRKLSSRAKSKLDETAFQGWQKTIHAAE